MATIDGQINNPFSFVHDGQTLTTRKPWTKNAWYRLDNGQYAFIEHITDAHGLTLKGEPQWSRPQFATVA